MAFDKDAFLTALDSMTVLELNDLVKAIEEKIFLIIPLAPAIVNLFLCPGFYSVDSWLYLRHGANPAFALLH